MKHKVLWIEDGALGDLPDLIGPVIVDGSYDLEIALDATQGIETILKSEFACVIVDIRLPPGEDKNWIKAHNWIEAHRPDRKDSARLGLLVLRSLLDPVNSEIKLKHIPTWIRPEVFGVLTVENQGEVADDLKKLKIKTYRQKTRRPSVLTLLELIEEVLKNSHSAKKG